MLKLTAALLVFSTACLVSRAHLCDNVFAQARDNLVVKVDIRDGQLRVGREGSFRVYVLNTMDRDIAEIALDVDSPEFEAVVAPAPEWRTYPALPTTRDNPSWRAPNRSEGKKEYFTVTLKRKPGVKDGSYKVSLNLVSRRQKMTFRTMDLESAADICRLPSLPALAIDGQATREKWGNAFLCANFYSYRKIGRYMENVPSDDQSRVRVAHDDNYLYFMASFHGGDDAAKDVINVYVAPTVDDAPVVLSMDRKTGRITGPDGIAGEASGVSSAQGYFMEAKIPRKALGIKGGDGFYMNFIRETVRGGARDLTFWRGNDRVLNQPIAYGYFTFAK